MVEQARSQLRVYNSLTKEKDIFVPSDPNQVTWYTCGPTVYDQSHLGHARTYVSFDILHRLMRDYFGYNVKLVMNITDVDDKIIRKSIEQDKNFLEIARHFETAFFDDMHKLNVALPETITRISEYIPENVSYIEQIIENGFAYESNGSVYFDVAKFNDDPNHSYAKLEPTSAQDKGKRDEGEGVLADADKLAKDKHNDSDFALWKKAKEGEPSWDSPWGKGRPGWHIECSAMASSIFKKWPIDIHTGGVDLRFPHHDNEIAQCEAYYKCDNWINNFWHTGPLKIQGLKMSKSLKNFITIDNILETYNPRVLRFMFLIHYWGKAMNFDTEKSFKESLVIEKSFTEFFRNINSATRDVNVKNQSQKWVEADEKLSAVLLQSKTAVHDALCDSFNTPQAVLELSKLISATNIYLQLPTDQIKLPLVKQITHYVFKMLKCFGLYAEDETPSTAAAGEESQSVDKEAAIAPLMNALRDYRDQVKQVANEGPKAVFQLSDELRDNVLPHLDIKLEDKANQPSVWKFIDYKTILAEKQAKLDAAKAKEDIKAAKLALELKKKSTPAEMWFKTFFAEEYEFFDEQGIPTHTFKEDKKKCKEINANIKNKLTKDWNNQKGKYEKWLESQAPATQAGAQEEEKKE